MARWSERDSAADARKRSGAALVLTSASGGSWTCCLYNGSSAAALQTEPGHSGRLSAQQLASHLAQRSQALGRVTIDCNQVGVSAECQHAEFTRRDQPCRLQSAALQPVSCRPRPSLLLHGRSRKSADAWRTRCERA
jgi:hypothetical protein